MNVLNRLRMEILKSFVNNMYILILKNVHIVRNILCALLSTLSCLLLKKTIRINYFVFYQIIVLIYESLLIY